MNNINNVYSMNLYERAVEEQHIGWTKNENGTVKIINRPMRIDFNDDKFSICTVPHGYISDYLPYSRLNLNAQNPWFIDAQTGSGKTQFIFKILYPNIHKAGKRMLVLVSRSALKTKVKYDAIDAAKTDQRQTLQPYGIECEHRFGDIDVFSLMGGINMKCTNCGNEFEGNFCTNCGAKAESGSVPSENIQTVIESNEVNGDTGAKSSISNAAVEKADSEGGGIFSKLFDFAFLIVITVLMVKFDIGVGWIIGYWIFSLIEFGSDIFLDEQKGLCAAVKCLAGIFDVFLMIRIGVSVGIMLLYLVIMIAHTILEYKKHALAKPAEIVSWVLGLIILFQLYNIYQDYRYANTVKEYQYATGVTYGELLGCISNDVRWECTDRERFNIAGEGTYDAVVRVRGDVEKLAETMSDVDPDAEYMIQFYVEKKDAERVTPVEMEVYAYSQTTTSTGEDIDDFLSWLYMRNFFGQILAD